jgi:hypothetical protein
VEILVDISTLQTARWHQRDATQMVRDLQARIEVNEEAMEVEKDEHARRHAQLLTVVEAKITEAAKLRERLKDISLVLECGLWFEKFAAGSASFGCWHTYCNRRTCASRSVDTCPGLQVPGRHSSPAL